MLYSTNAGFEVPVTRQSVVTLIGTNKWRWLFSTLSASSKLELFTKGNGYHHKSLGITELGRTKAINRYAKNLLNL